MIKISAKQFQKTSSQRHMSLQERKQILFNNARQQYIERYGSQKMK